MSPIRSVESLENPNRPPTPWERAGRGALYGGIFGAIFLAIGLARALLAIVLGAGVTVEVLRDLALGGLYVASFAVAGAVVGPLWPLRRSWWGALLVGYLAAAIVCAACGVIVMQLDHEHDPWLYAIVVGVMTLVYGTMAAYQFRKE